MADEGHSEDRQPSEAAVVDNPSSSDDLLLRAVAAAPAKRPPGDGAARLAHQTIVDGTFRIESVLGAGAMGVVYEATDLALDRRIALKLHVWADDDRRAARMRREAKAMARLAHPNVITVHEIGVFRGRVYIAMERVDGGTVREWLAQPRPWRDVVALFLQAARGLRAAHRVGLVHRDFKPANMLLGKDGRLRVADFGLVRDSIAGGEDDSAASPSDPPYSPDNIAALTETGLAIGTPAYMAPEQLNGEPVDHRSDQFAFCVALHEALYGVRPFAEDSPEWGRAAVVDRRIRPPPAGKRVPQWLRRIVLRGLEPRPADRFPDMEAVVSALEDDPRRRRWLAAGAALLIVSGLGTWSAVEFVRYRAREQCGQTADSIDAIWNEGAKRRLHDGMVDTGATIAEDTFERAARGVQEYAETWRAVATELCSAANVEGDATEESWLASLDCLGDRRGELDHLVGVLSEPTDPDGVAVAVTAVSGLGRVEVCGDGAWLARHPARVGTEVGSTRAALWRAAALRSAGKYEEGLAHAEQSVGAIDEEDVASRASMLVYAGTLAFLAGRNDPAADFLRQAYEIALAARDDDLALEAATELVETVGVGQQRDDEAAWWTMTARALLQRLEGEGTIAEGLLHNKVGLVDWAHGRYDSAEREHSLALENMEAVLGPSHPAVMTAHNNLGLVAKQLGRFEAAEREYRLALALRLEVLGPNHPDVAQSHNNLGALFSVEGRHEDALREFAAALAICERSLGREHPHAALGHNNLGLVYTEIGRLPDARREHERALSIWETQNGPNHPNVAIAQTNLGWVDEREGRYEEAEQRYRIALATFERALGPEHPRVGSLHANLSTVLASRGRTDEAERERVRALAIWEKVLGPASAEVASSLLQLAGLHLDLGRPEEAVGEAERALASRVESGEGPTALAEAQFVLARALWEAGHDRGRARLLAEQARVAYDPPGSLRRDSLDDVERWLATHRHP